MGIIVTMAVNLFLVYCDYNDKLKLQAKFNNNNLLSPFVPFAGDNSTTLNFSYI
jgi:hypothetical protein